MLSCKKCLFSLDHSRGAQSKVFQSNSHLLLHLFDVDPNKELKGICKR